MRARGFAALFAAGIAPCITSGCGGGGVTAGSLPVKQVATRDEAIRRLRFRAIPSVSLVTGTRLASLEKAHIMQLLAHLPSAKRERVARYTKALQAIAEANFLIGLIDPGTQVNNPNGPASTLEGLYDQTSRRVFLVKQTVKTKPQAEVVLAHELDHALDEQHFGPGTIPSDPTSDATGAEHALREGVATLTQLLYRQRYQHGRSAAYSIDHPHLPRVPDTKLGKAAAASAMFLYGDGARFVHALYTRGGWDLVNHALTHPPTTTAQILHPELYLKHVEARSPPATAAPYLHKPWHRFAAGDFGENDVAALLGKGATPEQIANAGRGWTGGHFEFWERGQELVACPPPCRDAAAFVGAVRWQTPAQRKAVEAQLPAYVKRDLSAKQRSGNDWAIRGGGGFAFASGGTALTLAWAPSAGLAKRIADGALGAAGAKP